MRAALCAFVLVFVSISPSLAGEKAQDIFDALKIEANLWEAMAAVAIMLQPVMKQRWLIFRTISMLALPALRD